jgi:branched-chain amino acid transport system substrate-binding protein
MSDGEKGIPPGRLVGRRAFLRMAGMAGVAAAIGAGLGGFVAACEDGTASGGKTTTEASGPTSVNATQIGREIKIGFVTPLTGGLNSFGISDSYCIERAREAIADGVVCGDGRKHPVTIAVGDSQSDSYMAAKVARDLIEKDKADIVLAASRATTAAPVADQCEELGVPCITTGASWQSLFSARGGGNLDTVYKWPYHVFWGLEDLQTTFVDMWNQVPSNKRVAVMFPNDADGNAWRSSWANVWGSSGLTVTDPGPFQGFTSDFAAYVNQFRKAGCEIGVGVFTPWCTGIDVCNAFPPDLSSFWQQTTKLGWKPKTASFSGALLLPELVETLSAAANGLTTEVWWTPAHPFRSSLLKETCKEFADKFTAATNRQWVQPLVHVIVLEMAIDVLKRTRNFDDREAMLDAVRGTRLDTLGGHIDFGAPVAPLGPPWKIGPCHIVENVYKTPLVGGQWRRGSQYPFELTVVSNAAASIIAAQDTVQPLE